MTRDPISDGDIVRVREGAQRMVNADRDRSEQPARDCPCGWCDWPSLCEARNMTAMRPVDAGTPQSAPAPSQAATEAHSDENEALRAALSRVEFALEDSRNHADWCGVRGHAGCCERPCDCQLATIRAALAGPATEEGA